MARKGFPQKRKLSAFIKEQCQTSDFEPWVEKFSPSTIEDLAVHKKKLSEVQAWFHNYFSQVGQKKGCPILILSGPPGAGKTAAVKAICKALRAELFIWSNSQQENTYKNKNDFYPFQRSEVVEYESQTSAFRRFLLHSVKYSLLTDYRKAILIEEVPNSFLRNADDFHSIVKKYCINGLYPAVFIISDNAKGDSLENRLFPKDLQMHLRITNMNFNAVAPTMLMKILMRINNSSQLPSGCAKLNKSQIENIASDSKGDIRNAINTMQFLCMTQTSTYPSTSTSKQKKEASEDHGSKRDSSLFLFHALGKILYCKRDPALKSDKDVLPASMKHLERDPLLANAENVYENTSISADAFNLFLQENYLSFVEDIQVATESSKWLSEADVYSSYWDSRDSLSDYVVSVAARGLMFNLVSCAASKRWKPLHKPHFYENNTNVGNSLVTELQKNRLTNSLRQCFKGTSLSMRELQIDFVPFMCKIQARNLNPAQSAFAKELGEMNIKRIPRFLNQTLDEKDCFTSEPNDTESQTEAGAVCEENDLLHAEVAMSDEEILIEEYDF